jgi:predicted metal-binding membrane protein
MAQHPAHASPQAVPLVRERRLILVALLILAAAAWGLLIWQAAVTDEDMAMMPTMGMGAPLFLAIWVAMMVAIMFPTAAPMILTFARVQAGKRRQERPFVPTWVFVGAYLLVWSALGILAFAGAVAAERLADRSMWLMDHAARIGGGILVLAGLYQVTPLKQLCLSKCRSPLGFIMTSWRDGRGGALRMGVEHGLYCAGCCWLLFVILFPLGMLNVAALALVTALIFAEKSLPIGRPLSWAAGTALVAYGVLVLLRPDSLPTMM